jgi:hypothetical protein
MERHREVGQTSHRLRQKLLHKHLHQLMQLRDR